MWWSGWGVYGGKGRETYSNDFEFVARRPSKTQQRKKIENLRPNNNIKYTNLEVA